MFHNLGFVLAVSHSLYTIIQQMKQQEWDESYALDYINDKLKRAKLDFVIPSRLDQITLGQIISYQYASIPDPHFSSQSSFFFNLELYIEHFISNCSFSIQPKHTAFINYSFNNKNIEDKINLNIYHLRACYMLRHGYIIDINEPDAVVITSPIGTKSLYTTNSCNCQDYIYYQQCHHMDLINFFKEYRSLFNV